MISGYTLGGLTRTVTHEPNRNLVDTVRNEVDAQLVDPQSPAGNLLISQFDYTNDKAGRRTDRDDSGDAFASTQANTFAYNARNEVIGATMRNGNSTYNFDQIGNRSSAAVPAAVSSPGGNFNYTANALNQYTAIENGAPVNPAHDLDGNLINDGKGTTFEWNGENRMVRVHKGDLTIENTYDGQGRRVRKLVIDDGTPIEDHRYFYDGWNLIFEYDEINALENTRYYVWGLDLSQSLQGAGGVGGLLLVRQGNELHAPTYDANGNISEYIDLSDGSITAHLEYDAFGRKIVSTGTAPSNFGFSTKYEDVETGYLYYGFRYYDPETGRWPNRDPIGERGGVNLYGFVGNHTTAAIDKNGQIPFLIVGGIIVVGGVAGVLIVDHKIDESKANPDEKKWAKKNKCCASAVKQWDGKLLQALENRGYNSRNNQQHPNQTIRQLDNSVVNAILHCSLTCSLASLWRCSVKQVREFGEAHESGVPNNPVEASTMDLYNNEKGLQMARNGRSIDDCITNCEMLAKNNLLKWFVGLPDWALNPANLPSAPNYTPGQNGTIP